jgi:hypothetical protein
MYAFDRKTFASVREGRAADIGPQPEFRVTFTFVLDDGDALWSAARLRLLADGETTDEMVHETIGPPDAPSLEDCLAVLCDPGAMLRSIQIAGCRADDFWIDAFPGLPPQAALEPADATVLLASGVAC